MSGRHGRSRSGGPWRRTCPEGSPHAPPAPVPRRVYGRTRDVPETSPRPIPPDPGSGPGANSRITLPIRGRKAPEGVSKPPSEASHPQGKTASRRRRVLTRTPPAASRRVKRPTNHRKARSTHRGKPPCEARKVPSRPTAKPHPAETGATSRPQQVNEGLRFRHPRDVLDEDRFQASKRTPSPGNEHRWPTSRHSQVQ